MREQEESIRTEHRVDAPVRDAGDLPPALVRRSIPGVACERLTADEDLPLAAAPLLRPDARSLLIYCAPAASQASKVVGAIRASGPGSSTSPAMEMSNMPRQVGTNFMSCPRTASVRRAMSTKS